MTTYAPPSTTVDRMLDAIAAGRGRDLAPLYADDAVLDATVPNWRFHVHGADAIGAQYAGWFSHPARFEELCRRPVPGGEVVNYFLEWQEAGVPYGAHHCHVLELDADGRIARDTVFCGGRWDAALMAAMADADAKAGHAG